jgi:outer membrane immunogenic protein
MKVSGVLAASALALFTISPADAADVSYRVAPPPAVFSWTGFYAGISAGYGFSNDRLSQSGSATTTTPPIEVGIPGPTVDSGTTASLISTQNRPNGPVATLQAGANLQLSRRWVVGLETDISSTGFHGTYNGSRQGSFPLDPLVALPPTTLTNSSSFTQRMEWLGTVRGRLGFTINDTILVYGTGGLAYGEASVSTQGSDAICTAFDPTIPVSSCTTTPSNSAFSKMRLGYTAGGGVEYAVSPNWSFKTEFLYWNLGSVGGSSTSSITGLDVTAVDTVTTTFTNTTRAQLAGSIVRIGINYKID